MNEPRSFRKYWVQGSCVPVSAASECEAVERYRRGIATGAIGVAKGATTDRTKIVGLRRKGRRLEQSLAAVRTKAEALDQHLKGLRIDQPQSGIFETLSQLTSAILKRLRSGCEDDDDQEKNLPF